MAKSNRMAKLRKAETKKDPFKTGESFTTLNNLAAREAEHHALLNNMGFPSEQPLEGARYQRYSEHTSDPDSPDGVDHNKPYWIVNEASEMIYNIPDDDAPSFKGSAKAKSRAKENTMDVKKSGLIKRQVKLMKQGGSDGTRIKNPRSYTPSYEVGEIGDVGTGGGTSLDTSPKVKPTPWQPPKTTTTPKTSTPGASATSGPEINTGQEKPWQAPTPTAKPADTSVVPSDTGTRPTITPASSPEVGTAIFDPPTPDPELPARPTGAELRGTGSQPWDTLGPAVGDTAPRVSESNIPVTGFGSPTSREAQLQQGLTATWSPGQKGGPFVGTGPNEGFDPGEYQEGSGVVPFEYTPLTRGESEQQGYQDIKYGGEMINPEEYRRIMQEEGEWGGQEVDRDVLSQREADREMDRYQRGLQEGLIPERGSGIRRPGFVQESGDMEKSLTKRLIKLQKSQGRMLEKQGLGEIGPTNTGGGRKMPKTGGASGAGGMGMGQAGNMQAGNRSTSPPKRGMGVGRAGTSSPMQEGSMQSPRMKVPQRTPAPKPTGSGQGMGEIGST